MTAITGISIAGTLVDLDSVHASVSGTHGRSSVTDSPAASSCTLTLVGDAIPTVEISDLLEVQAYGLLRFTGVITDATPRQTTRGDASMVIVAIGALADLALEPVTATDWPQETSGARATRILTAAGASIGKAAGTLTVLPMDGTERMALDMLTALAADTGAAVFDLPDGTITFQDLIARKQAYLRDTWATATGTWAASSGTWAEQLTPAVDEPVVIPASCIAWQPTLTKKRGVIVNHIAVEYGTGSPRPVVTEESASSIARHKRRSGGTLSTQLALEADATTRAENIMTRQAHATYQLGNVTVLVHDLDTETRDAVMGLVCGARVVIQGLPDAYPITDWLGVVEGWSEQFFTDNAGRYRHTLGLSLSDPRASFAGIKWSEVTAGITWADVPAGRIWADATTLELLTI